MESAFTGVLLESALKLSNVTDANIFILVETSEGRQWAGNRRLKVGNVHCIRFYAEVGNVLVYSMLTQAAHKMYPSKQKFVYALMSNVLQVQYRPNLQRVLSQTKFRQGT